MLISQRITLSPNNRQETLLRRSCGVARFAYNWALGEWKREYEAGGKPGWPDLSRRLTAIKREQFPWMLEVTAYAPSYALMNLGTAFKRFFQKKGGYPQFKKKGIRDGFEIHPKDFSIRNGKAHILKIGLVRMRQPMRWDGKIKSVVVSNRGGKWFLSLAIETSQSIPQSESQAAVGVDLGVTTLATLSTGEKVEGLKAHKHLLDRLRRLNKSLSRKVKGSRNRDKARRKLARLHARIGNIRRDALHQLTHRLTRDHGVIAIEDLNVAGMVRNRRLARSIMDASFGEFRRQVTYKAAWRGVRVVAVGRYFPSSKTCSACGCVAESLPLSVRSWRCPCGAEHDRDINAARNILAAGLAVSACGDSGSGLGSVSKVKPPSMKQESTSNRKAV